MIRVNSKKYRGVFWIVSNTKLLPDGRPDRSFYIRFHDGTKRREEHVGWQSEGMTEEAAYKIRTKKILERHKYGHLVNLDLTMDEMFAKLLKHWETTKTRMQDRSRYDMHIQPVFGNRRLSTIKPHEIEVLKNNLLKKYSPRSVEYILKIIGEIFNKAIAWGFYSGINPVKRVTFPRYNNQRLRYLTKEEITKLMTELYRRNKKVYVMAYLSLFYGLRPIEIFNLRWNNINFNEGVITIHDTKNMESKKIYVTRQCLELFSLIEKGDDNDYVFKTRNNKPYDQVPNIFDTVVNDLGLNARSTGSKDRIVFYTLRHTFATHLKSLGYSDLVLQDALGHKTTAMTKRYSKMIPEFSREVAEKVESHLLS